MIRALGCVGLRALANMRKRPFLGVLTVGSIAISMMLVALAYLVARNLETITAGWGTGVQMVVYLEADTSTERARRIRAALGQLPAVDTARVIPADTAHDRLRAVLGQHDELLEGIEPGMLPTSIEVTLASGIRDVVAAHPVIERLEAIDGVEEVELVGGWVERLTEVLAGLRRAGWVLFGLVAGACLWTVTATLRLNLHGRRQDNEAYRLVGASSSFLRGPVLLEGILHGAVGAGIATGLLWLLYTATADAVAAALSHAFDDIHLAFLQAGDMGVLIGLGAGLGLFASWLATGGRSFA